MIESFSGRFRFLSNFYPAPVRMRGVVYPTTEHAFQAAKTLDREQRARIAAAPTPGQAKRMGRTITLREDWEQIKLAVMEACLRQKFSQPTLRAKLLATGDQALIEGNHWGDTFWGVCQGNGTNHLGKLLMKIREEMK